MVAVELHKCAGLAEVAFAPGPLKLNDGLGVDQRAEEVSGLVESCGAVGKDHGELFAHELLGFPGRPLDGDARGHGIPLEGLYVQPILEQSLRTHYDALTWGVRERGQRTHVSFILGVVYSLGEVLGHDVGRRWTAEVGVCNKYAREAVEGAVVDVALVALLLLVQPAQRGGVLWWTKGNLDWAEALLDESLHERVWGTHDHLLLLLLLRRRGRGTMGVRGLARAVRVSVRHCRS
ncbi:hypothetical protein BD309DRAFT_467732 [Dichomitus squalens]|uniref:Uncharacterized protein n=1 Tax=Dichomitus squalens TaxID=114155 RepID=A0A4Q9P450_9APHY|nr:hypothetical protein BD309DRAFT_467732 [Dichomitus squalens]TBU60583.1 hypothetical protein BD310DRAFT_323503 [Dichomitus squalens]